MDKHNAIASFEVLTLCPEILKPLETAMGMGMHEF